MILVLGCLLIFVGLSVFFLSQSKSIQSLPIPTTSLRALRNSEDERSRFAASWMKLLSPFISDKKKRRIESRLEMAGYSGSRVQIFMFKQVNYALLGLGVGLLFWLYADFFLGLLIFPIAFFLFPILSLNKVIVRRQRQILMQLPYYFDLLTLSLESGMDLIASIEEIAARDQPNPLKEELELTLNQIQMGTTRSQAFQNLGERTRLDPIRVWALSISESEELGSSLGGLMRIQGEGLRDDLFRQAEERAAKAPVALLVPLVIFIFPATFVLLLVPLFLQVLSST